MTSLQSDPGRGISNAEQEIFSLTTVRKLEIPNSG
jgi:hypothetical protein